MKIEAALYMIPVGLSEGAVEDVVPGPVMELATSLRHFIVEDVRTARRFLRKMNRDCDIDSMDFKVLNRHTDLNEVSSWLDPLRRGEAIGVMSEAGCPGVADPGALPAAIAQREGLRVIPLSGPSSILMSLMASGMNGQGFTFNGYLPIEPGERGAAIKRLEATSRKTGMSQIFIETPYRNAALLTQLSETLSPETLLCVATAITDGERESVRTMPARKWRGEKPFGEKVPAIFLIHAEGGRHRR